MSKSYWKEYWNSEAISKQQNLQVQVGRTVKGIPINVEDWKKTVQFIIDNLSLSKNDTLVDLCCGNGVLSTPFSQIVQHVISVDFSEKLLLSLKNQKITNIDIICEDALEYQYPKCKVDKIILYFAIQHFQLKDAFALLQNMYNGLNENGIAYIGEIPDINCIWEFFYTPEYRNQYFESILKDKPIIGTWFEKKMLIYFCKNIGFREVSIISQPHFMPNSHYRFDLLLKK